MGEVTNWKYRSRIRDSKTRRKSDKDEENRNMMAKIGRYMLILKGRNGRCK
jgi:hypothetical protein